MMTRGSQIEEIQKNFTKSCHW